MIILHGFAYSSFYGIVKHVLLHRYLAFEEEPPFSSTEEFLNISPLGKGSGITAEFADTCVSPAFAVTSWKKPIRRTHPPSSPTSRTASALSQQGKIQ